MGKADYWVRVSKRAIRDTFLFFGGARILLPPIFFTVGSGIHLYRSGADSVLEELDVAASYGVFTFFVVWGALFFVNFILTPSRIEAEAESAAQSHLKELRDEIEALKLKISNRDKRQTAMNALWELRTEGVNIRNREITEESYKEWYSEYVDWESRVYAEAAKVSPNLERWVKTLDRVRRGPRTKYPSIHNQHDRDKNNLSEVLFRLQEFLEADMLNRDIQRFDI